MYEGEGSSFATTRKSGNILPINIIRYVSTILGETKKMLTSWIISTWLATAGCGINCASGVIANLKVESKLEHCIVTKSGAALAQWAGARKQRLMREHPDWCTRPTSQLEFLVHELKEIGTWESLKRSPSPEAAARQFMLEFERPRSQGYGAQQYREGIARSVQMELRNNGITP